MKIKMGWIWNYIKSRKYILLFSLVYFAVKLFKIDSYFYLRDERDLILTALSLAQTGKDLYGNSLPLVFSRISPQSPLLGMYWTVPIIILFSITSPLAVKILYLLPTLFFPFLVFEMIYAFTKEWKISFLTSFVVSFSPWYFHISRLGIEAHLAYFFALIGIILYLRKNKIIGLLFMVLSYFSYFGIRPLLLLIVPYLELWQYAFSPHKKWKALITNLLLFFFVFGAAFALGLRIENTLSRSTNEIIFLNKEKLTLEANFLRSISDAPFAMRAVVDNKLSIIGDTILQNFFKGVDFSYLYILGDYTGIYSNQVTGQFFPFLFPFLIVGIVFLAKEKKQNYYLVASFVLVGLISSLINSYSLTFSVRSIFSLIGIGFLTALGFVYLYELIVRLLYKKIFLGVILTAYILFSFTFVYKYLFQNYKTINSSFIEQERYISNFSRENSIGSVIVPNMHSYMLSYLVTLPSLSSDTLEIVQEELNKSQYNVSGIAFIQCNGDQLSFLKSDLYPKKTIIEESCIASKSKLLLDLDKSGKVERLKSPEYANGDINGKVKYYYFK